MYGIVHSYTHDKNYSALVCICTLYNRARNGIRFKDILFVWSLEAIIIL